MLLGSGPNRRLTKDETQSPAIAEAAASAPSCHDKLMTTAAQAARSTAAATPRQVFERPSRGCPSHNTIPPSIGRANRGPSKRANRGGAPLATPTRTRLWRIARAWADIHFYDGISVSVSPPYAHVIAVVSAHCKEIPPVTALLDKGLTAAQRDEARAYGLTFRDAAVRYSSHVASRRSSDLKGRQIKFPIGVTSSMLDSAQLCQLVGTAPSGPQWLHEIKLEVSACPRASSASGCNCCRGRDSIGATNIRAC